MDELGDREVAVGGGRGGGVLKDESMMVGVVKGSAAVFICPRPFSLFNHTC